MFRSLRSRVALTAVLAVLGSSIIVLISIALATGPLSRSSAEAHLHTILNRAIALEGNVPTEKLADRLVEPGYSILINHAGRDYLPSGNTTVIKSVDTDSNYLMLTGTLPKTGVTVTVTTANPNTFGTFSQILWVGIPTIAAVLIVVVLALGRATKVALRPLDDMTSLALKISEGELGERLAVENPNTELGRTAVAFDRMLDELEESLQRARLAEARLRQLCADVAHELRSPLSSMVAAADNLMREVNLGRRTIAATKDLAESAAMAVVRDGRRAGRIVGDLTLAAQLDVQELAEREVVKQRIDPNRLVAQVVESFTIANDYSISMTDGAGTTWVKADPERLQQIVTNLLSNAARWTETSISVETTKTKGWWHIAVTDDGPGVPADQRENIFGRFVRLDHDRARSKGGTGLGLAISLALAEAHGGTLVCLDNATEAGGAVFKLSLPTVK